MAASFVAASYGTLAGPFKNWKSGTQGPSGTLPEIYKNRKYGTLDLSGTLRKTGKPGP